MAVIEQKNGKVTITLDEKEAQALGELQGLFDFFHPKKGLLVLTENKTETPLPKPAPAATEKTVQPPSTIPAAPKTDFSAIDEKLFRILSDRNQLSNRIEGKFEKTLNTEEKKRFEELLKDGTIEKFKLNEQYKNAVYRLDEKKLKEKQPRSDSAASAPDANASQLNQNGFVILKNDSEAREITNRFFQEFKKGEIRGLKSFDGSVLMIKTSLLQELQPRLLQALEKEKKASLQTLSENTRLAPDAVRIACEFLKEDGHIFEKTKNQYCVV